MVVRARNGQNENWQGHLQKGGFLFFFFFLYCYYFLNDNLRVVRMKESIFGFFFGAKK
jgi:hypothetical protein